MLSLLFRIVALVLRIINLTVLVYCVMSFVMPQSEWYRKLAAYVDPLLNPIRFRLWKWFPSLRALPVDLSPVALWLLMDVLMAVLNMLRRIL